MLSNPVLAAAVEERVGARPHVDRVKANPASGSLLVAYDASRAPADLESVIAADLDEWLHGSRHPRAPVARTTALAQVVNVSRRGTEDVVAPILLSAGGYALTTLQGLSLGAIVSVAIGESPSWLRYLGSPRRGSLMMRLTAATALITAATTWVNFKRRRAWRRYAQDTQHRLRTEIFRALESQDMAFFDRHGTGELLALLTDDVGKIGALVEEGDVIIESYLTIVSAVIALVAAAPSLALIAASSLLLILLPVRAIKPKVERSLADESELRGRLNQALENIFSGVVEVKSFTAERFEAERVTELSAAISDRSVQTTSLTLLQTAAGSTFFYNGYTLAMSFGAARVLSGQMSPDQLNQANFWYPRLISSVGRATESSRVFYAARTSADRVTAILNARPHIHDGPDRVAGAVLGDIAVHDVSFGYIPSMAVLRHVSLQIAAGTTVGIVGPSGSGKSTLLRLILRLYDPTSGQIFLDGRDITSLAIRDLRASVALVAQDPYLFNDTVMNNVRYGRPDATDIEVVAAIAQAGAEELAVVLPDGLQSEVGERGHRLSGGQRQRVAIARALLKAAPILALDEPTAHLDYRTEMTVLSSLKDVTAGVTVILVAHRLANVREADHIVVLDQGEVREEGDHRSLLERRGLYYEMWQLQDGTPSPPTS